MTSHVCIQSDQESSWYTHIKLVKQAEAIWTVNNIANKKDRQTKKKPVVQEQYARSKYVVAINSVT